MSMSIMTENVISEKNLKVLRLKRTNPQLQLEVLITLLPLIERTSRINVSTDTNILNNIQH